MPDLDYDTKLSWERHLPLGALLLLIVREVMAWLDRHAENPKPAPSIWSALASWGGVLLAVVCISVGFLVNDARGKAETQAALAEVRAAIETANRLSMERHSRQEEEINAHNGRISSNERKTEYLCTARALDDRESGRPVNGGPCN